jgi:hypothetical protein
MGPARLDSRNLEDFRSHGECSLPIKTQRMSLRRSRRIDQEEQGLVTDERYAESS